MFEQVTPAPPDPILGLSEAFLADPNPGKISLAVGVYKDASGQTPILESVKAAERVLLDRQTTKGYLPIDGSAAFAGHVQALLFGPGDPRADEGRLFTAHTPGGTGALRVAADYLKQNHDGATVWLSEPTWANHPAIFEAAGVATATYAYFDAGANALDLPAMLDAIRAMPAGDVVLLHGCCHNPTGVDPTAAQWEQVAEAVAGAGVLPLIDFAYQGFGDGLEQDAVGLRTLLGRLDEALIGSSYSKNFGLYRERVGALTLLTKSQEDSAAVGSRIKAGIRRNYSNPPGHGAAIVTTILDDADLRTQWESELAAMRSRINTMRSQFQAGLDQRGVSLAPEGNGFISRQHGMFTLSGLTREQVQQLRENHSIYIVGSGRINVAGMTDENLPLLCDAIAKVTADQ
jgi:aspartate/tyrosine/aromatic aminotransferase